MYMQLNLYIETYTYIHWTCTLNYNEAYTSNSTDTTSIITFEQQHSKATKRNLQLDIVLDSDSQVYVGLDPIRSNERSRETAGRKEHLAKEESAEHVVLRVG